MAITTPPTIMIGAATIRVQLISTSICTCCTSLVSRVIREGRAELLHLAPDKTELLVPLLELTSISNRVAPE